MLVGIWSLFVMLVALGIHGSSTGITAQWWAQERPYSGYLMSLPPGAVEGLTRIDTEGLQSLLMGNARLIRWDEFLVFSPYALSQTSHTPRFPVVNTNIGNGQNMLVVPHAPVWHIVTLARPATWGYFLFGAQRGLAWFWWFQIFACFTVLFLLFDILLRGRKELAAFGAFWVCASAYFVCWSEWPSHVVFFVGLGCLAAYQLFASEKKSTQVISAILLGLSFPGFVMILYPPWQVAAGYFFALLFILLFIRDKLYLSLRTSPKYRLGLLALALVIAGSLTLSWVLTCLPDLKVMSDTVYPGRRVSLGGDYSFALLFKGMYNLINIYFTPPALLNASEAASFYYFFPAVVFAALISKRIARKLGLIGWSLIAYIAVMTLFVLVGLPESIAKITLLSYIPSPRVDLTIGLASILLCMHLLCVITQDEEPEVSPNEASVPLRVAGFVTLFFIFHSLFLMKKAPGFPPPQIALLISIVAGGISYCLIAGKVRAFCAIIASLVVATTALFNPLATNLDHIYGSELARAITNINKQSNDHPFWVSYGGTHPGVLVEILGGKSLSGVQWPPQLDIWHALDPNRTSEQAYNMYAEVSFDYLAAENTVEFKRVQDGTLRVQISPYNPVLKTLGTRYVLILGDAQKTVDTSKLAPVYHSSLDTFSIFEIPADSPAETGLTR
ncbi:MAG TPA: hypothetical protein VNS63_15545 [Blastocatellia bacterium]|nr:hypothetical protein [Blastocatellia bacterium]